MTDGKTMDKGTVLVTGGAGYIGSHAVLALRDAGWPVVVIDNLVTGFRWAIPNDVPFVQGDVADQTQPRRGCLCSPKARGRQQTCGAGQGGSACQIRQAREA